MRQLVRRRRGGGPGAGTPRGRSYCIRTRLAAIVGQRSPVPSNGGATAITGLAVTGTAITRAIIPIPACRPPQTWPVTSWLPTETQKEGLPRCGQQAWEAAALSALAATSNPAPTSPQKVEPEPPPSPAPAPVPHSTTTSARAPAAASSSRSPPRSWRWTSCAAPS